MPQEDTLTMSYVSSEMDSCAVAATPHYRESSVLLKAGGIVEAETGFLIDQWLTALEKLRFVTGENYYLLLSKLCFQTM